MKLTLPSLFVVVGLGCTAFTGPVLAQNESTDQAGLQQVSDAQARITYAGDLRMLSQVVPAAACHLAQDIDTAGSIELLKSATAEFDTILQALEFGDAELNIQTAETRRKTIAEIQNARSTWAPTQAAAEAMLLGNGSLEDLGIIVGQDAQVLAAAEALVTDVVSEYFNPVDMVKADAFMIDIASRQRTLAQLMSKEVCLIASGQNTLATPETLQASMDTFSSSLQALRSGLPGTGIRRPPTAGIEAGLEDVLTQWNITKLTLDVVVSGGELNSESATNTFQGLNAMMDTMDEVVGMYRVATE